MSCRVVLLYVVVSGMYIDICDIALGERALLRGALSQDKVIRGTLIGAMRIEAMQSIYS